MNARSTARGRPRAISRAMLQEAAFELFLELGYDGTTVNEITQRAGVSRGTFFNNFAAKSDVFWVDLDDSIDALADALGQVPATSVPDAVAVVANTLVHLGRGYGAARVPWALTQSEFIGAEQELQASALSRFVRLTSVVTRFIRRQHPDVAELRARTAAYAMAGAVVAAAQEWAAAGSTRGDLASYLQSALDPVVAGFGLGVHGIGPD
ncbi:TetR/AcrR family transcriptional regulator [Salinibacterium sp. ZJ450]|uniref:TetR/AcrR family transcriptional regulator n=1 Tax=Salinibacterium sp. ZJ450 TaxID=2708338 RepID=UPI001421F080|nr:TetR/AcrR family transcriptional regulator [Salinibacterium sp. ZJ450]